MITPNPSAYARDHASAAGGGFAARATADVLEGLVGAEDVEVTAAQRAYLAGAVAALDALAALNAATAPPGAQEGP